MLFTTQCKTQILNSFLWMAQWLFSAPDLIILAQQWKIDCVLRHKIAHKVSSAKQRLQWSFLPIYVKETASQSVEYTKLWFWLHCQRQNELIY